MRTGKRATGLKFMNLKHKRKRLKKRASSRTGSEPRLIFPSVIDRASADARLERVIDDWLVPRLVEEFLREHAEAQEPPGMQEM
jgi:hypothetical protein